LPLDPPSLPEITPSLPIDTPPSDAIVPDALGRGEAVSGVTTAPPASPAPADFQQVAAAQPGILPGDLGRGTDTSAVGPRPERELAPAGRNLDGNPLPSFSDIAAASGPVPQLSPSSAPQDQGSPSPTPPPPTDVPGGLSTGGALSTTSLFSGALYAVLCALLGLAALRLSRLTMAWARLRPQAFTALLERPG
jgi:hypothetical protein